jgi:hypothetical protein
MAEGQKAETISPAEDVIESSEKSTQHGCGKIVNDLSVSTEESQTPEDEKCHKLKDQLRAHQRREFLIAVAHVMKRKVYVIKLYL